MNIYLNKQIKVKIEKWRRPQDCQAPASDDPHLTFSYNPNFYRFLMITVKTFT